MHEIENNIICIPQCYRENMLSTNIGNLEKDRYYDQDCIDSMTNPSQKSVVTENRVQTPRKILHKRSKRIEPKRVMKDMKKIFQRKKDEILKQSNTVNTREIEIYLYTLENLYLKCEFHAQKVD